MMEKLDLPKFEEIKTCTCEEDWKKNKKLRRKKKEGTEVGRMEKKRWDQCTNAEIKEKQQVRKFYYCQKRGGDSLRQEGKVLTNF